MEQGRTYKEYNGVMMSRARYSVCKFLEKEIPKLKGSVLIVGAGDWKLPSKFMTSKVTNVIKQDKYKFDDTNIVCPIEKIEISDEFFDNVISNQMLECVDNPFDAVNEMYRVLKPGGTLLIDTPFNYHYFTCPTKIEKNPNIKFRDNWRFTHDGLKILLKKFSDINIDIEGEEIEPYCYLCRCVK